MLDQNEQLKTLDQQIEDATNKLLSINNELNRMKRLHDSEDYAVAELQGLKADISSSISTNKILKEKLEKDVEDLRTQKDEIDTQIIEANKELSAIKAENATEKENIAKEKEELSAIGTELSAKEEALNKKESDLALEATTLQEKHNSIKELVNKLS